MNDQELIDREFALQTQAAELLADLGFSAFLRRYGRLEAVGSYATGLMTWRDIDFNWIADPLNLDHFWMAARHFASHRLVRRASVEDNRDWKVSDHTPSLYLQLRCFGLDGEWKIDLHYMLPGAALACADRDMLLEQLTPETRLAILRLKTALMNHPAYRRRFFSTDLYHAVLDEGVRTLEAFQTYLREIGLELELV